MHPDPSSSKIQRYSAAIFRSAGYMGLVVEHDVADDGPWVKWSDVEARLAQLEQEQATLKAEQESAIQALRDHGGTVIQSGLAASIAMTLRSMNATREAVLARAERADAALGEIRQALQQVTEKYETLLARVGGERLSHRQDLPRETSTGDR